MANPRGQQRDKPFRDALRIEIAAAQDENDFRSLRKIARQLLTNAAEGKVDAIKEVADRLDGKVPQAVVGDTEEDAIQVLQRIERVIVDSPANQDGTGVPPVIGTSEI